MLATLMVTLPVCSLGRPLLLVVVEAVPVWPCCWGWPGWASLVLRLWDVESPHCGALPQVREP